jgi:hypothetical protein
MTDPHPARRTAARARTDVSRVEVVQASRCRCGRHLAPGASAWAVDQPSPSLEALFRDQRFCSVVCLRAFILEALEEFDALDRPEAVAFVSDLHDSYAELANVLQSALSSSAPQGPD